VRFSATRREPGGDCGPGAQAGRSAHGDWERAEQRAAQYAADLAE
jgi:hypothetical protein